MIVTTIVLAALAADISGRAALIARDVAADLAQAVRPGGVNGRPFWNANAIMFMYPPAFDFKPMASLNGKTSLMYDFEVHDANGRFHNFWAESPQVPLTNVWAKLPTGFTTVTCRAAEGGIRRVTVGTRAFWKSAPFTGDYPKAKRPYAESARMAFDYVLNAPSVRYFAEKGELDPSFFFNVYPTKMLASIANAACAMAAADEGRRAEATALARKAVDWLIAHGEKTDAPLPHFPPTYRGTGATAGKYAGQVMMIYPASAANAYLKVHALTGEGRYLEEAEGIAAVYVRLQGADGTWPLKMTLADGKPVGDNRLIPVATVLPMLEKLAKLTGKAEYRRAADRALASVLDARVSNWNWEGQFEDVPPNAPYTDMTKHDACATAIYLANNFPKDAGKMSLARDLLRFAEDQFVCWEKPYDVPGYSRESSMLDLRNWTVPGVLEQYFWYNPIDASSAKLINTYLALWRAERKPLDLAKARALGDVLTRVQWNDGGMPTEWALNPLPQNIWMNCHIASALALDALAKTANEKDYE